MKPETHKLADEITYGLGPLFRANPDYGTILSAMCVVMARVIQSTPETGREARAYEYACERIGLALAEFLRTETELDAKKEDQKEKLDAGISGFDKFAKSVDPAWKDAGGDTTIPTHQFEAILKKEDSDSSITQE
jgi:hypothetical protein